MATTQQFQERVRRAVHEALQKTLAEGGLPGPISFLNVERCPWLGRNVG